MSHDESSASRASVHRGNARDIVILLALVSAPFFALDWTRVSVALWLVVVGCALHFLVKGVLIRNRVLCRHGIYSIARHPYYLSNFIIDSAYCLLSGNIYLLFLCPFLFFWAYGPSLRKEEEFLLSVYGQEYADFSAGTAQLFPSSESVRLWRQVGDGFSFGRVTTYEMKRISRVLAVASLLAGLQTAGAQGLMAIVRDHAWPARPVAVFGACALLFLAVALLMPGRGHGLTAAPDGAAPAPQ